MASVSKDAYFILFIPVVALAGTSSAWTLGAHAYVSEFMVGAQDRVGAERPFGAGIDEVKLYNYAVSSTEVTNLFLYNSLVVPPRGTAIIVR